MKCPRPLDKNVRGLHGSGNVKHDGLLSQWRRWEQQFREIKLAWFTLLDVNGSGRQLAQALMSSGVIPVVRPYISEPCLQKQSREQRQGLVAVYNGMPVHPTTAASGDV